MNGCASCSDEENTRLRELAIELQRLRECVELSSEWFWEQDAEFRFTRFYGSRIEKLRRDQNDFLGKRRWEMPISGVTPEQIAAHVATYERHEAFRDFEYAVPGEGGVLQHYSVSGTPLFDGNGVFVGYLGVGRNVTELRLAEQALMESRRRLAQIVDRSPVPIFVIDKAHCVTDWNQACERLTGVPAPRVVGGREAWRGFYAAPRPTMADLVIEDAAELNIALHYGDKCARSRLIPGAYEAEDFFPQMSGGRWLFFTAAPLHDSRGLVSGAIETLQDVTERKVAERAEREHWQQLQVAHAELQQTMRQLVEAEKLASLGRLVSGIAHELNTPLGNAMVVATSLQDAVDELGGQLSAGTVRRSELERLLGTGCAAVSLLISNVRRAADLVERFRQVASAQESGQPQVFQLRMVVDHVVHSLARRLADRNVDFVVDVPEDIVLESHPVAVDQILFNLVDNSLVHGFAGKSCGTIRVSASVSGATVALDYLDDGCGMDDDVRRHAFDPFYTTRLGQGGSGLGLYLAHNLATAALGGSIEILDSREGGGAHFRVVMRQRVETAICSE